MLNETQQSITEFPGLKHRSINAEYAKQFLIRTNLHHQYIAECTHLTNVLDTAINFLVVLSRYENQYIIGIDMSTDDVRDIEKYEYFDCFKNYKYYRT